MLETKVSVQTIVTFIAGYIAALIAVHVFHGSLSPDETAQLPNVIAAVIALAAAYLAPHTPRLGTIVAEVSKQLNAQADTTVPPKKP